MPSRINQIKIRTSRKCNTNINHEMLHEVLLALSGHPSPLFGDDASPSTQSAEILLSPTEKALLQSIGELSHRHRRIKSLLQSISNDHPSIICRAVAVSLRQTHLGRFQQRILDVERRILTNDASLVGAYDIVPLASIVAEFDDWYRLMGWYMRVAEFMLSGSAKTKNDKNERPSQQQQQHACTGAELIDELRREAHTGYPEIEKAATELMKTAEMAWLRQLASWIVYGRLPAYASQDFFVKAVEGDEGEVFVKDRGLLPEFVSPATANAILFVGKSISQVERYRKTSPILAASKDTQQQQQQQTSMADLATVHLKTLSALTLPISSSQLSRTISSIRLSLSRNVLQYLLPMEMTTQLLSCLQQFFLLTRGEFALALIEEAESRLRARQHSLGRVAVQDPIKALRGLTLKDAELNQALQQVWKSLVARDHADSGSLEDVDLEYARQHISLVVPRPPTTASRPSTADSNTAVTPASSLELSTTTQFNDLLFPSPTELTLTPAAPLSLFISTKDISTYSHIHNYLLAIRRGHLKLSSLWRRTAARRTHPSSSSPASTKTGPQATESVMGGQRSRQREKQKQRTIAMRKVWATCSAAVFLLSETAAFFEGEIVKGACEHFEKWVRQTPASLSLAQQARGGAGGASSAGISTHAHGSNTQNLASTEGAEAEARTDGVKREESPRQHRDPETLAAAHRIFLSSLVYALLLSDQPYTQSLRTLLGAVDKLVAYFVRLLDVQSRSDVDLNLNINLTLNTSSSDTTDARPGLMGLSGNEREDEEEKQAALELDRARKQVDTALKDVVARLRALDQERVGSLRFWTVERSMEENAAGFETWKGGGGVNRLLMKLDFGRMPVVPGG